jgi:hypothetical protein
MLSRAVAGQLFEPIAGRDKKIIKAPGRVQHLKLAASLPIKRTELRHVDVIEQSFSVTVTKRSYHALGVPLNKIPCPE